jgi:hypothetical protein
MAQRCRSDYRRPNILHDCIGRSAKRAEPTALVTVANTRGARIYCAAHVIDEFVKYREVWAAHYRVSAAAYQDAFVSFYRPLVRTVPTDGLEEMLLPDERARLDVLRVEDSDDVPTATLAIALGAVPITKDHAPWKAVHGAPTDALHLDLWLSRLMSIGDRAETEKLLSFTLAGVAAPGVAAIHWGTKLYRYSPLAFGIAAAFIAGAAFCIPRPVYRKGWDAIKTGSGNINEAIMTPHVQANGELQRELPPFPTWTISSQRHRATPRSRAPVSFALRARGERPRWSGRSLTNYRRSVSVRKRRASAKCCGAIRVSPNLRRSGGKSAVPKPLGNGRPSALRRHRERVRAPRPSFCAWTNMRSHHVAESEESRPRATLKGREVERP